MLVVHDIRDGMLSHYAVRIQEQQFRYRECQVDSRILKEETK